MRWVVFALLATWVFRPAPARADECASLFIEAGDIEHCRSVIAQHSNQQIQDVVNRDASAARSLTIGGAVLLALGGVGMTAVLVDGSVETAATRTNRFDAYPNYVDGLAAGFAVASSVALTGAILVALGARRGAKAQHEQRMLSALSW